MQDRELVAAIVNGDPGGLVEAYDRYAASLYTYCRSMLPDPHPPAEAADAVADTFTIATAKLAGLRDPDQLGSWLRGRAERMPAPARDRGARGARGGRRPAGLGGRDGGGRSARRPARAGAERRSG